MTDRRPARVHDLIRLRTPSALTVDTAIPPWVLPALRRSPWVVVRRGVVREGRLPIGVRGRARSERFAAWAALTDIAERLSPEDLIGLLPLIERDRQDAVPALLALGRVASVLVRSHYRWGPIGSVGFELATGEPMATFVSDLDVIVRQEHRLDPSDAVGLFAALVDVASPARLDAMLETPCGGVLLADLAAGLARVLVRTPEGPRLCANPWAAEALSATGHRS